jgi:dihydroneopterin aldolase
MISDLELHLHLGVTSEERISGQRILVSLEMVPYSESVISDDLEHTVDYAAVRRDLRTMFRGERIKLIETVAERIAGHVLEHYRVRRVTVTVKKFPYRDASHVAYRLCRDSSYHD